MVKYVLMRAGYFEELGVTSIWVFDGVAPPLKDCERKRRQE
jgi:hypothetical protein